MNVLYVLCCTVVLRTGVTREVGADTWRVADGVNAGALTAVVVSGARLGRSVQTTLTPWFRPPRSAPTKDIPAGMTSFTE